MPYLARFASPHVALRLLDFVRLFRGADPRIPRIDPKRMPDYLRRDLGFEGGRISPPRNPFRD